MSAAAGPRNSSPRRPSMPDENLDERSIANHFRVSDDCVFLSAGVLFITPTPQSP